MRRLLRLTYLAAGTRQREFGTALRLSLMASVVQAAGIGALIGLVRELAGPDRDITTAWSWFLAFVVLYAVESVGRLGELRFQYTEWADVMGDLRLSLGEQLRSMPLRELEKRSAGDLSAVVGGNVAYAAMGVAQIAFLFLQAALVPTLVVLIVLVLDWRMGLVLLVSLLAVLPIVGKLQRRAGAGLREVNLADASASARIVEYVQGLPVLRAAGQTGEQSRRLDEALRRQTHVMAEDQRSLTIPAILTTSLVQLGVVAAVGVGAWLALTPQADPRMGVAMLAALAVASVKLAEPLATASAMIVVFELSEASIERIDQVLEAEPLVVDAEPRTLTRFDISFDDVVFGYEGTTPVLDRVHLSMPERSLTALVGPSGSGKSTIARLITRYDDPWSGSVRIGGVDLRGMDPAEIYRHVSVVFQDVYLFEGSIGDNIAMGRPGASRAEIEAAARAANVHTFVELLPQGYDTPVGEVGALLSGGERQRVSIARAILKNAPIVLLDEPTAALDSESEVAVQAAVDALVADKTVLVIAHRLSTVVGADQILVVDEGGITERGRHEELLEAGGRYAAMWQAQTRARRWRVGAGS